MLRELFKQVTWYDKRTMSPRLYAVVEALVEAVEPEDTDVRDATIRNLREACHIWEQRCLKSEQELAESNAGRGRLARKWGEADAKIDQLRTELAEAKTNIAGLLDSIRWWKQQLAEAKAEIERLRKERDSAELKLKALEPIDERIRADAEIGRLVQNMENETGVHYCDGQYYALRFGWKAPRTMGYVPIADSKSDDPAAALAAIQEVGDAEV